MKILLITGGNSSERTVSLNSAKNVRAVIIKNKHKATLYDLNKGLIPLKRLAKDYDLLFPVLHGEEGESGLLHKYLSRLDKPIVGTRNYNGMKKAWYKIPFKKYCDKNRILTPKWKIIKKLSDIEKFGYPCVIKTSSGGSSLEVFILKNKRELTKVKPKLAKLKNLFIEEYLIGTEITVGILDNKALLPLEIIPPNGGWFDYKNKYSGKTKEILNAPSLSQNLKIKSQAIALKIHKHFRLGTYSRIDFIVKDNKIYCLELNTIPGLTETSLLPKETGMSFEKFIEVLINKAA
jgi:D-alanine-D-alanine ligase